MISERDTHIIVGRVEEFVFSVHARIGTTHTHTPHTDDGKYTYSDVKLAESPAYDVFAVCVRCVGVHIMH